MKIFRAKSDVEKAKETQELRNTIETFENMLEDIRHIVGQRRTMLKNADKKLQEFQDTMYAIIMEDDYPPRKFYRPRDSDDDSPPS